MQKIAELISEDITERILEKLNEIEKSSNLSNLDVSTILNKLPAVTSKGFVTDQNELWKDVSKLSVDFYLDFKYYKQFTFQSKFSCAEYHDALKNLGFKEINGFWKSYCKPSKTFVINYVVQSCVYRTIMMKMNEEDSVDEVMTINNTSELMNFCPFCDKNLNNVHNCEACSATAEEIENLRNQAKLIENKHNPSVGGGIEVVGNDLLCTEHVDSVNITGNSLIKNENSKSIPNINLINKQKINRGTQCGGVGKIALNQVSFVVPKITSIGENLKSWTCKYCGGLNDEEKMNCVVCMEDRTKLLCKYPKPRRKILPSKKFHENKANDNNNDDNREKDGRTESWTCWNGECEERNDGNELYCKKCGLDKSASRERGATVDMSKYGKIEQVWICYECNNINYDLHRSICYLCGVSKFHVKDQLLDEYVAGDNDNNKWKCSKCQYGNDRESLSCKQCKSPRIEMWSCKHCTMRNQISDNYCAACGWENVNKIIKYCSKCKQKEIIFDDLCGDCLKAQDEIWTCWNGECKERNDGNELYCKKCGLDKSASRERGATVDMSKYGKIEQVWICYECNNINYDLNRSICDKCYVLKFDIKGKSNNKLVDDKHGAVNSDGIKWKCIKCQYGNDRESLSCKQCQSPRIEMWSCEHCTMLNQISDNHCAACGWGNVNKTIKYCSKCRQKEIICDDLCGDCLKARDETWICWYRFCENRNAGNVKYCQNCGLDRYADKINIGKPMWRCKGDVRDQIWICYICSHINDISRYLCQNHPCCGKNKYTKRCYKCEYKYNYESSNYCEICKEIII